MYKKGFTLIELLVVIAIIALLLSIVMPGLNLAKRKAASIVCMTNVKNLSLGWYLYQSDNSGNIMSAHMRGMRDAGGNVIAPGWIREPYHITPGDRGVLDISPPVTDEDEINGIKDGALYPYLESVNTFNCPADRVISAYDGTEKLVTYGIPTALGSNVPLGPNMDLQHRITKFSQITSPSSRYNFVESSQERNWNMAGHWFLGAPEYTGNSYFVWRDPMSVSHGDSSVLGFTDGHAETRRWQNPFTKERVGWLGSGGTGYGYADPRNEPGNQIEDIDYMGQGWPYRYRF